MGQIQENQKTTEFFGSNLKCIRAYAALQI